MINEFTFWNVRHGLFYTGSIGNRGLNFLYDCGSLNRKVLSSCIKCMNLPEQFDFAVISHLHKDHINGINILLDEYHIKDYYLPYIGNDLIRDLIVANLVSHMEEKHKSILSFDFFKEILYHSERCLGRENSGEHFK